MTLEMIEDQRVAWLKKYAAVPDMLQKILTASGVKIVLNNRCYLMARLEGYVAHSEKPVAINIIGQTIYGKYVRDCGTFYMVLLGAEFKRARNGVSFDWINPQTSYKVVSFMRGADELNPRDPKEDFITPGHWMMAVREAAGEADKTLAERMDTGTQKRAAELYKAYALDIAYEVEL